MQLLFSAIIKNANITCFGIYSHWLFKALQFAVFSFFAFPVTQEIIISLEGVSEDMNHFPPIA